MTSSRQVCIRNDLLPGLPVPELGKVFEFYNLQLYGVHGMADTSWCWYAEEPKHKGEKDAAGDDNNHSLWTCRWNGTFQLYHRHITYLWEKIFRLPFYYAEYNQNFEKLYLTGANGMSALRNISFLWKTVGLALLWSNIQNLMRWRKALSSNII